MSGKYNHVAVLMGGLSSEREVSLKSGEAVAESLAQEGYRVSPIDVGEDLAGHLARIRPDACFNALHGKWGEDGCVQGLLEVMKIPYTHSGVLASSVAMNKDLTKTILHDNGVPVAKSVVVSRERAAAKHPISPPYVLKPVADGSSVGIFMIMDDRLPSDEIKEAGGADDLLMAEEYVHGREFTCAVLGDVQGDVLGGRALAVTEIRPAEGFEFYDFASKYKPGGSIHTIPAELSPDINLQIQSLAAKAHKALGCRGVSRSDFRYDDRPGKGDRLVCLEINTQPGMTATSLAPEQASYAGMSFGELVRWLVEDASCDR